MGEHATKRTSGGTAVERKTRWTGQDDSYMISQAAETETTRTHKEEVKINWYIIDRANQWRENR